MQHRASTTCQLWVDTAPPRQHDWPRSSRFRQDQRWFLPALTRDERHEPRGATAALPLSATSLQLHQPGKNRVLLPVPSPHYRSILCHENAATAVLALPVRVPEWSSSSLPAAYRP